MSGMQLLDLARDLARDRDRNLARGMPAETATFLRPRTGHRRWRRSRLR
jgi:hypothetical protein